MAFRNSTLERLRHHRVPAWWQDAKLGIFVHWTMASVPAFAPVGTDFSSLLKSDRRDAYSYSPYVEWYQNSLRFPDSPVARHHLETYGERPYESFRDDWEAGLEQWDPEAWAEKFRASGARHVVLVAKHADGYCLWPTDVPNPHRPGWHSRRDVVGELAEAVRGAGMRFGLYYSGGMDWTFDQRPLGSMSDVVAAIPRGDYPAYAEAQVRELIDRYRPSVLWNDIAWPSRRQSSLAAVRSLLPTGTRRGGERPMAPVEPAPGHEPLRGWPSGHRCHHPASDEPRWRARAAGAAALRRSHSRVRGLSRCAIDALGVRARHGRELRLQRLLPTGGLHRPRRAVVAADRRRCQGREPLAQRWTTRR